MNLLKNYKLQASSLIESVMAIAIISICVFIATMVYVKLLDSDYEVSYYKAMQKVTQLHLETIEQQAFEDEVYDYKSFKIDKTVNDYSVFLKEVAFRVETKNKKETFKYLVKVKPFETNN
ncbi:hypothetical protein [Lacinutrix sp. Hel_I_90]|uniref:hypothetical protein n=1 Tax=Lacinutrix sp. Hel_I_90 TaxID=1249999 RepID=UPI0005CB5872|nr:hypothetical protein [Lacinutrix sp. Hel_I_90]